MSFFFLIYFLFVKIRLHRESNPGPILFTPQRLPFRPLALLISTTRSILSILVFISMPILCLLCGIELQSNFPSYLSRHYLNVHLSDPSINFKCPFPGCENFPSEILTPLQVCQHHCSHLSFSRDRHSVYEEEAQERQAEGFLEEDLEDEQPLPQFDEWLLDDSGGRFYLSLIKHFCISQSQKLFL